MNNATINLPNHTQNNLAPLSNRCDFIDPFAVMELVKEAMQLEASGKPIIHLSIGEPDFGAPPAVMNALTHALNHKPMRYTQAVGITPLREAISQYYLNRFSVTIDPARIIVTAGASAALTLACAALVNPGDKVLMVDPSYPCNRHFVAAFDGIAKAVNCGPEQRFQMSAATLAANWDPTVKGTLLASPSNPTGTAIAFDELAKIMAIVRQKNAFAIIDEIYLELSYDQVPRTVLELGDDMVVCNSFSKFFNMTGWRLGWLVVPPQWAPTFEKLAQNLFICPSTLAQQAALTCFEADTIAIYEARKQTFKERRDYLVPALQALGFKIPVVPDGAFYVYADASAFTDDTAKFAQQMLHEAWVSMVPGDDFGKADPKRYLRISYATGLDQLKQAVVRLEHWLKQRAN